MSVVIVGGNECMIRQYLTLCKQYNCRAKVLIEMRGTVRNKIGNPDLMVLFTSTLSHKMLRCAMSVTKGGNTVIARSHTSSMSALKEILEKHATKSEEKMLCRKN
ncbi:MAG: DUF2325 domain-containing protein [Christensenella sp.]|nr:DUF2325 domain-containing protein [Christensenella sp.]